MGWAPCEPRVAHQCFFFFFVVAHKISQEKEKRIVRIYRLLWGTLDFYMEVQYFGMHTCKHNTCMFFTCKVLPSVPSATMDKTVETLCCIFGLQYNLNLTPEDGMKPHIPFRCCVKGVKVSCEQYFCRQHWKGQQGVPTRFVQDWSSTFVLSIMYCIAGHVQLRSQSTIHTALREKERMIMEDSDEIYISVDWPLVLVCSLHLTVCALEFMEVQ